MRLTFWIYFDNPGEKEKLKKIILYQRKTNCNYIITRISAKRKEHNKSE